MIIKPTDIAKILTAAAPIVASLVAMTSKSEKEENKDKEKTEPINVTINNNFYTKSEKDAEIAAEKIRQQVVNGVSYSQTRYTL